MNTVMIASKNIHRVIVGPDWIDVEVFGKTGGLHRVTLGRYHARRFNYLENLGWLMDTLEEEIGHPLTEQDKAYVVRCCREPLTEWSK